MKTLTVKTIIVFLICGALFFSCAWDKPNDYGTLVINLPGSGQGRAAGFDDYIKTLHYRVECSNGVDKESETFSYGTKGFISLLPGEWSVTVYVLDTKKPKEEQIVGEWATEQPVIIEAGRIKDDLKIIIYISYGDIEWPSKSTWEKYGLSNGLTQSQEKTTVAYVIEGQNSLLDPGAVKDFALFPTGMGASIEGMGFLMVKLEFENVNNDTDKNNVYYNDNDPGLYQQVMSNSFVKKSNSTSMVRERWDVFEKSTTTVYLYMNYLENCIIILAVQPSL